jgi:hypothetical protein
MGQSQKTISTKDNTKLLNFCIIASPVLLMLGYLTGQYWLFIPALLMVVYAHKNRAKTKQEKEGQEDLSHKALAASLFIPIIVIFLAMIFVLIKVISLII